jgi:hypothetical protein
MNKVNPILTAVMSKLISDRDNVLAQLDLVLNKNLSDYGVSGIIEQTAQLFKKLSEIDSAIDTVKYTIENNSSSPISEQIDKLKDTLEKMQGENNNNKQNNDGDNS